MSDWAEQAALDAMQRAEPEMGNTAFHRRLYRQIVRALREARAMGPEWQPIETAPKDGTQILMVIAGYEPLCGRWRRGTWTSDPDKAYFSPTHWQPLPAAPKES